MLTARQFWLLLHLGFGVVFIHAFAGGVATLTVPRPTRVRALVRSVSTAGMAVVAWLTVVSGTWLVYPGYRAEPAPGDAIDGYPKSWLVADGDTSMWHTFGMEWKEHVGWLAPFLATAVAVVAIRYRHVLADDPRLRRVVSGLFSLAFAAALVASALGAAINKVAPNDFLTP